MGAQYQAICRQCGRECSIMLGGGFHFHLLHCDQCGRGKNVPFDEVGDREKETAFEQHAGSCGCCGGFRFDAPPRCPNCRSADLDYDKERPSVRYD